MFDNFIVALFLFFIIEGVFPFLNPAAWRKLVFFIIMQPDFLLRLFGLLSVLFGLFFLFGIKFFV